MRKKSGTGKAPAEQAHQGHPPCDPQAVFGRREGSRAIRQLRACLKIGLGGDSGIAANMIHTWDVDTQAAKP
ncbi:hypothetical protein GGQ85_004279, partial [Nitrobacter vulgaris]|nr:hypothetical protein [Nitrobacter vulgaris]